ncbi:MAG: dienelactone hydrolase family protein [Leptolyngbyaceae cyanobacterium MO_188.B28]|nr:dienelactone hydrolase family protein [Leptolyngbyaceae cyanobacterium MO_188.B28]
MGTDIAQLGYLATPKSGSGAGLIVLQEWWGLVPHIKDVADRFAQAGYVALAPDLYRGESTTSPDDAGRLMMALNIEQAAQDLQKAVDYLLQQEAVRGDKVGVVGFCMGGQLALLSATVSSSIAAVVDFYGIHPKVQLDFSKLSAPILGLFGEQDSSVPPDAVKSLETAVRNQGGAIETKIYPNAGHAFFNDTRADAYQSEAAIDAWDSTLKFFKHHLTA